MTINHSSSSRLHLCVYKMYQVKGMLLVIMIIMYGNYNCLNYTFNLPWPTLKRHHDDQRKHGLRNIIKCERVSFPLTINHLRTMRNIIKLYGFLDLSDEAGKTDFLLQAQP